MNKQPSSEWRRFLRRHRGRLNIIFFLAMINLFTGWNDGFSDFTPWFLFPAVFIGFPIFHDLFDMLIGQDEDDEDREFDEEVKGKKDKESYSAPASIPVQAPNIVSTYSPTIQTHLDRARTYREQIEAYIQATADPHSQSRLQDLSNQIDEWTAAIEAMAQRINSFQQNPVINQDLESVPQSIANLKAELKSETNDTIRAELERTLANRQNQLAALQNLENTMKQAEIKMESTLASLGTIYSQLLTSQSTDHVADYSRLSADVNEEVSTLQDHLEALEEVKLGRSY